MFWNKRGGKMIREIRSSSFLAVLFCILIHISGCGGGGSAQTFTVGGALDGSSGTVVLSNNGSDRITTGNGSFTFPDALPSGSKYLVARRCGIRLHRG